MDSWDEDSLSWDKDSLSWDEGADSDLFAFSDEESEIVHLSSSKLKQSLDFSQYADDSEDGDDFGLEDDMEASLDALTEFTYFRAGMSDLRTVEVALAEHEEKEELDLYKNPIVVQSHLEILNAKRAMFRYVTLLSGQEGVGRRQDRRRNIQQSPRGDSQGGARPGLHESMHDAEVTQTRHFVRFEERSAGYS